MKSSLLTTLLVLESAMHNCVRILEEEGDVEAAIQALAVIDNMRKRVDKIQADPPRYRKTTKGYH